MTAALIDGTAIARQVVEEVAAGVDELEREAGVTPGLATILVGEDPASQVYVRRKHQSAEAAGVRSFHHAPPASTSQQQLERLIEELNGDPAVHGILVQSPLPRGLDEPGAFARVDPRKDVDGFHPLNAGRLLVGQEGLRPCTPAGIMELLERSDTRLEGARAVVIGRSAIVGKPVALMLLAQNATVTMAHSRTRDLPALTREADVLVVATGVAKLVGAEMVKPGATVIDVGIHRVEGGLVGDVDPGVTEVAGALTPVPGGVGPMTVAMLLRNTLAAARALARQRPVSAR